MKKRLTPDEFVQLARSLPRDERTPYAFEKRIMARLSESPVVDALSFWTHALWKAITPCFAVMLVAGAISWSRSIDSTPAESDQLDLESIVLEPTEIPFDSPA